jgi:predicted nuclease with RNAse H fold
MSGRWLGIDFSGDYRRWSVGTTKSNVWVATVEESNGLKLKDLKQPQQLTGSGTPFERLIALLSERDFDAAAIDAPFSVPQEYVPNGSHGELLELVGNIPREGTRAFPSRKALLDALSKKGFPLSPRKQYRQTDRYWLAQGVGVRPPLWNGARPGAPMTAACLTLLYRSGCPIWPWSNSSKKGLLVEAFPAAQLRTWSMKFERYNGSSSERQEIREEIVDAVVKRVKVSLDFIKKMRESADALDAVVCSFAAIAVTRNQVAFPPQYPEAHAEGWISVMRNHARWHQG